MESPKPTIWYWVKTYDAKERTTTWQGWLGRGGGDIVWQNDGEESKFHTEVLGKFPTLRAAQDAIERECEAGIERNRQADEPR